MSRQYKVAKDVAPVPVPNDNYQRFVDGIRMGMPPLEAARQTGCKDAKSFLERAMNNQWVVMKVKEVRDELEQKMGMSRDKVQQIILDAVEMAKLQGVPADMIRGAAELNKMLGYYAPEEKKITLDSREGQLASELETMDEEQLLELAGMEQDAIEAEFEELDNVHELESSVGG